MYRILLVEDDNHIREAVADYFEDKSNGSMQLDNAEDGNKGLEAIYENHYDLILLDVMLPGVNGFEICREIRKEDIVPIIFLTARGREEDVLFGYENGCDDYIVKPFSVAQLYAKVQVILKRAKGMNRHQELVCGNIRLNPLTYETHVGAACINLAPKEFLILRELMEKKGQIVLRDTLISHVWGYDFDGNERVIDNHIKKLRKQLGEEGKNIKTVMKQGYKIQGG